MLQATFKLVTATSCMILSVDACRGSASKLMPCHKLSAADTCCSTRPHALVTLWHTRSRTNKRCCQ